MDTDNDTLHIGVYGTLKEGFNNYDKFLSPRKAVYKGFVTLPFLMYGTKDYPMLIPSSSLEKKMDIYIEIFELNPDELKQMDAFEAEYEYHREDMVLKEWNSDKTVGIYVYDYATAPSNYSQVNSGKWEPNQIKE